MINKYEDMIKKIIDDTDTNKITWEISDYQSYASHIVNAEDVLKAFKTEIKNMNVIVLESKGQKYFGDFDSYLPIRYAMVLLIKDNILAKILTDDIVKQDMLFELVELVAEKVTNIDNDIDAFLEDI